MHDARRRLPWSRNPIGVEKRYPLDRSMAELPTRAGLARPARLERLRLLEQLLGQATSPCAAPCAASAYYGECVTGVVSGGTDAVTGGTDAVNGGTDAVNGGTSPPPSAATAAASAGA